MQRAVASRTGAVCTFYSYKGGVGRTQALANVAVLLMGWGYRVLCIDWDLEAPGLHLYYDKHLGGRVGDGVVELMTAHRAGARLAWERHLLPVDVTGPGSLELMPAGRIDDGYGSRMQALDWQRLYAQEGLALAIEQMREELREAYDFVLVDSRTGITDMGGICAVQLPDLLVALFTASQQSLDGVLRIVENAARERQLLPFERGQVPTLPVITRFEATVEVRLAQWWMQRFERRLARVVAPWKHRDVSLEDLLPLIRIPHVAHWSFGEDLPVLEEGTGDPVGIGYAFETLAALVANRLERSELLVANRRAYVESASTRAQGGEFRYDVYVAASADQQAYADELVHGLTVRGLHVLRPESDERDLVEPRHALQQHARNLVLVCGKPSAMLEQEARSFVLASATETVPRRLIPVLRVAPELVPPVASSYRWVDGRETPLEGVVLEVARAVQEQLHELHSELRGPESPAALRAAEQLGRTLLAQGDWATAAPLLERTLERLRISDPDSSQTLHVMNLLVGTLHQAGRYEEAFELAAEALARTERQSGTDGVEAAHAMQQLARARFATGETDGAFELLARAAELLERALGAEHRDTLDALNGLAQLQLVRGRLAEARPLVERLVEASTRRFGDEDQLTLVALSVKARLLLETGEIAAARQLAEQLVEVRRRLFGADHPETLTAVNNLVNVLRAEGDFAQALELEQSVVDARRRLLGEEHPETLMAMSNAAVAWGEAGDLGQEREIEEHVLEVRRRLLGEDHPDTLTVMANLAGTRCEMGELASATALAEQVLERRRRVLGPEHPDTIGSFAGLAKVRLAAGDADAARPLAERALEGYERTLGPDHRLTLATAANLAAALRLQNDLSAAQELEERVLRGLTQALGMKHPETIAAVANLALTLRDGGDLVGARALQELALSQQVEVLGEEHVDVAHAMIQLAATLRQMGELPEARHLQERALELDRRLLGPFHRDTVVATAHLADTLRQLGEEDAASELLERLARDGERSSNPRASKDRGE